MVADRIIFYLAIFILQLGMDLRPPLLGLMKTEFGLSVLQVGLLTSSFGIARLLVDLPAGVLVDRFNGRKLLFGGVLSILLGSTLSGLAPTFLDLLLGQFLIGFGAGLFSTIAVVSLSRLSSPKDRGITLSLYAVSFLMGSTFSPIVSGGIASEVGWRIPFLFSILMTGLVLVLLLITGRWLRALATVSSTEVTPRLGKDAYHPSIPRLPVDLVSFGAMNLVSFLLFFVGLSFMETILPVYAATVLQLGPATIGTLIGLATGMRVVMNLICGALSDRYGRRNVIILELIILGLGFLLLSSSTDMLMFVIGVMSVGVGRIGNTLIMALLADEMPSYQWGTFMGINRASGDMGILLGPIVLGGLVDWSSFGLVIIFSATLAWFGAVTMAIAVRESSHSPADKTV